MAADSPHTETQKDRLLRFEKICDRFEEQCKAAKTGVLASFLADMAEPPDAELLVELIHIDLGYLHDAGITVTESTYLQAAPAHRELAREILRKIRANRDTNESNPDPLPFRHGPRYQIIEKIASGGMGTVFRAKDNKLNREVALKLLRSDLTESTSARDRLIQEAKSLARLQHPGIVEIFDVDVVDGNVCIALEFVEGGNLSQKIARQPQHPDEAASLVLAISKALQCAHEAGVIHRDLKPSNILISTSGEPKIADFGLAKLDQEEHLKTFTGELLGTASYMAPEQALGQVSQIDQRTDVYGLGAILYELLTGVPPFQGQSSWDTIQQLLSREPVPPRVLQPAIPRDLETICQKSIRQQSTERYASVDDLAEDLQRYLEGRPIRARPVGLASRFLKICRRNLALTTTIALSILVLVTISVIALKNILAQRNLALEHAYESSHRGARALLQSRSNDWWQQAEEYLARAAEYRNPSSDPTDLRELAISWMGMTRPSLQNQLTVQMGTSPVVGVGLVHQAKRVLSVNQSGVLAIYCAAEGNLLWKTRLASPVRRMRVSKQRDLAAILFEDGTLSTCRISPNVDTLEQTFEVEKVADTVTSLEFNATGELLAYADMAGRLTVQSLIEPDAQQQLFIPGGPVVCLAFSSNAKKVAVGLEDSTIAIVDRDARLVAETVSTRHIPVAIAFGAEDRTIVFSDNESFGLNFLDGNSLEFVGGKPNMTDGTIRELVVTDQSQRLVASTDGTLRLFSRSSSDHVAQGTCEHGAARCLSTDRNIEKILVGYADGSIVLWNKILSPYIYSDHKTIHWCAFANHSATLWGNYYEQLSYDFSAGIPLSNSRNWQSGILTNGPRPNPEGHQAPVWGVAISPDDRWIATASHDGTCKIWSTTGELRTTIDLGYQIAWAVRFNQTGTRLAIGGDGVALVDTESFEVIAQHHDHQGLVFSVAPSADGNQVFSAGKDGTIRLLQVGPENACTILEQQSSPIHSLALRADNRQVAAACEDGNVLVFDTPDFLSDDDGEIRMDRFRSQFAKTKRRINDHPGAVHGIAYSRNSRWLVSGSQQGHLLIHDADTLRQIVKFQNGSGQIRCISFSADDRFMAVSSYARPIIVWDLRRVRQKLRDWNIDWQ